MTREEAKHRFRILCESKSLTKDEADEALKCYKIMYPWVTLWDEFMKERIEKYGLTTSPTNR